MNIMRFSGGHIVWIAAWAALVATLFHFFHFEDFAIPWQAIGVIGTAVAFYIGFKNNQAYDRLWEARKIWGAIVNSSRMLGATVKAYVSNQFTEQYHSEKELHAIHQKLLYRHIAYLYSLRSQLLIPTSWEHISQRGMVGRTAKKRMKTWGVGLHNDDVTEENLKAFLPEGECSRLINYKNTTSRKG